MSKSVMPIFSAKTFIVSGLEFTPLVHCEFIFMCGVRQCSNFILGHDAVSFSQHHLLKRKSLLHCIFLPLFSYLGWPYVHRFISGLSIQFHWSTLYFCSNTILFGWLQLRSIVWNQGAWFLQLHFSFSRLISLFRVFCVPITIVKYFVLIL